MITAAGAGPMPIPQQKLTGESLSQAIRFCLSDNAVKAAETIAQKMQSEIGVEAAARYFHCNLPVEAMCCDMIPHLPAAFSCTKGKKKLKLSSLAAAVLCSSEGIKNMRS